MKNEVREERNKENHLMLLEKCSKMKKQLKKIKKRRILKD